MANTYKNIVITPNRDTDAANVPFIRFSGGDATSNTDINVRVYTTQSGTLSFEGSAGQLFSITNDLTNTIFSVNDVSGIPSLEIDAAGLIKLAEFGGNVAIGRSNASHKFDIVGTANASNLLVNGNMVFTHANDGAGSNFDSDLLDGQQGAYYGIATDVSAANRVANAAFLNANAGYAFANSAHAIANLAFVHANAAYTQANAAIASASAGQATANAAFTRANNSLLSSSYTAADVLAKLITVDGAGTNLDADLLDGQQGTYYGIATDVTAANRVANAAFLHANAAFATANVAFANANTVMISAQSSFTLANNAYLHANAAFASANAGQATANAAFTRANNSLLSSAYTAADVLAKLITVDGAGTTLDADLLDGQQGAYYGIASDVTAAFLRANNSLLSSSYTAADVLAKLITVDGAGTTLDADLLDGQQGAYYGISTDVSAANRVANAAFLHANAAFATANVAFANANTVMISAQSSFTLANNAYLHANAAFATANTGQTTAVAAFARANNSLLSSAYTAADVLAKLITVDGAGTSLDADLLDGQQGTYYGIAADVTAAFLRANNSLLSSSYTAADVLSKLLTVDGAGTNLDADLLDGQQGAYYGISTDVSAANRVANAAFLHANAAFATANGRVSSVSGTGTVSGITLTGTVTTTGSLTLGGTLSASVIDNMTDEHRLFNNMGDTHATRTAFDLTGPSINFGWRFVQGSANGPGVTGTQFYSEYVGLGNEYSATGAGSYGMQIAYPRNVIEPYITIRYNEANTFAAWTKVSAGNSDKLNSQAASYYGIATDVTAANRVANAAFLHANSAFATVNSAFATINVAFANANTVMISAQAAFTVANNAYLHANVAFATANTGQTTAVAAFARANNSLLSSAYTAADVLAKLITVDGSGTTLDADLLDGQQGTYYGIASDVTAAFLRANNSLLSSSYTAADVLAKLITVDGAGTTLDADLLDGQQGAYYGIATDVSAANRVANAAFLHANAAFAFGNSAHSIANLAFVHANAAFAKANSTVIVISPDALNATRYITFEDSTTGNMANANVSTSLTYNPGTNRLAVGGTGTPSNTLHVFGTANVSGTLKTAGLYDSTNRLLLIKNSSGTVVWGN